VKLGDAPIGGLIADAVAAAKKADVAVVFAGHIVGEGMDRAHLALPAPEDALIEAVARANPRTVVVLTTGGAVTMPWLKNVAGVIEMWLPGDSFGTAAARLLFGDVDPGGRLPVTFPADETQGPATKPSEYPGDLSSSGAVQTAHFDEGIEIGYRYWDAHNQKPLFAFGYGLSYARFAISDVTVEPQADGTVAVAATVRNTGGRTGSDVVEVYLGFPAAAGEPPKQLKAFAKVDLKPGEIYSAHMALDRHAFESWDEDTHAWIVVHGNYKVMVGRSSRDIVSTKTISR
jgi:beta-glucosidase